MVTPFVCRRLAVVGAWWTAATTRSIMPAGFTANEVINVWKCLRGGRGRQPPASGLAIGRLAAATTAATKEGSFTNHSVHQSQRGRRRRRRFRSPTRLSGRVPHLLHGGPAKSEAWPLVLFNVTLSFGAGRKSNNAQERHNSPPNRGQQQHWTHSIAATSCT